MEDRNNLKISTNGSLSLGTISWIVWIVFMILYYGVKVDWLTPFWVWFPFWFPFALYGSFILIAFLIGLILTLIEDR